MSTVGNNSSGELQRLRDAFFGTQTSSVLESEQGGGELEYLKELIKNPKCKTVYEQLKTYSGEYLKTLAYKIITRIETGKVPPERLEIEEAKLCLVLGAVEDLHKEKGIEKVLELER